MVAPDNASGTADPNKEPPPKEPKRETSSDAKDADKKKPDDQIAGDTAHLPYPR